jgi:hypothetical protein
MSEVRFPLLYGLSRCSKVIIELMAVVNSQLEAIIRISESLAKMTLAPVVQNHHVEEAIRLFKYSTMDAVSAGSADGLSRGELNEEMTRIERELRRRLPVGWSTSYQSLVREFVTQQGYSSHALERTLFVLEKREVVRFSGQVSTCMFAQPSVSIDWVTEKSGTQSRRLIHRLIVSCVFVEKEMPGCREEGCAQSK